MPIQISKDTLWKGILEDLFEDFLHYFFPEFAQKEVDFAKPFEFLDKELEQISREMSEQKRKVDKLVKVFTRSGGEKWCLVHVEVQGYEDQNFAERMFDYFIRIRHRYQQNVTALVIYTDKKPDFQPERYEYEFLGTELNFRFNTYKLLSKEARELEIKGNPFSLVMLTAHQALQKGAEADAAQLEWKFQLTKQLLEAGYSSEKIRRIFQFIRYYVSFKEETNRVAYEQKLSTIIQTRKNMGIEEAILADVKEQGSLETKVESIQRALQKDKYSLEEIAEFLDVSLDFVEKVKSGVIE